MFARAARKCRSEDIATETWSRYVAAQGAHKNVKQYTDDIIPKTQEDRGADDLIRDISGLRTARTWRKK